MTQERGISQRALHAWLLLLPALVLLAAFTHYPAVATLWDSFHSTPKGQRPAVWVGFENYQVMAADPVFWKAVVNNLWFALATIPLSVGLALAMALWVNGKIAGRGFLRMAYFTPTVLPMIAVANIWLFFYTPSYGLLEQIGNLFGLPSQNWLGDKAASAGKALGAAKDWASDKASAAGKALHNAADRDGDGKLGWGDVVAGAGQAKEFAGNAVNTAGKALGAAKDWASDKASAAWDGAKSAGKTLVGGLSSAASTVGGTFKKAKDFFGGW